MQDRSNVSSERQALAVYARQTASPEFLSFIRGASAALDWAMGRVRTAPVSGTALVGPPAEPAAEDLTAEVRRCDALLASDQSTEPAARRNEPHYVNGVEHALRWLLGLDAEPPVPFDEPSLAAPAA
jgi:hypothetical protein